MSPWVYTAYVLCVWVRECFPCHLFVPGGKSGTHTIGLYDVDQESGIW